MATYNAPLTAKTDQLTLTELLKRIDPNGKAFEVGEVLNESNEIIQDVVFKEGNLPTGDQQSIRTGLPDVYWRQFNQGTPPSHATQATVTETCGALVARSQVDSRLLELNGLDGAYRFNEDKAFIESMGQSFTKALFYGNAKKTPEGINGLSIRYSTLSKDVESSKNIIDCKGTNNGGLASIWIVGWGDNIYAPYPKGTKAGLQTTDYGKQLVQDDKGNTYPAYVTDYDWQVGLMVRDWRYAVRLANIDVEQLMNGTGIGSGEVKTDTNILMKITEAFSRIPRGNNVKLAMYMNADVFTGLEVVAGRTHSNVIKYLDATTEFGAPNAWASFKGVPLRRVDQLVSTENQVK